MFKPTINDLFVEPARGWTYHLHLKPSQFVPSVLIVGDPGRAQMVAREFFDKIETNHFHRGLRTVVGRVKETQQRVMVTTSGMGTGSLEIVVNELGVVRMFDFRTGARVPGPPVMNIIRLGTSGALAPDVRAGSAVISQYAIGLDGTGHTYVVKSDARLRRLEETVHRAMLRGRRRGAEVPRPYATRGDSRIAFSLEQAARELNLNAVTGITVTAAGLFNGQGRAVLGVPEYVPDLDFILGNLESGIRGMKFCNTEMEAATLFRIASGFGDRAGAICIAVDNRHHDEIDKKAGDHIRAAAHCALRALAHAHAEQ